jgi:hypothetical protein
MQLACERLVALLAWIADWHLGKQMLSLQRRALPRLLDPLEVRGVGPTLHSV